MSQRLLLMLVLLVLPTAAHAQGDAKKLAAQARQILEANCYVCHGKDGANKGGLNYVLDVKRMIERNLVVPKNLNESSLWLRVTSADDDIMPPTYKKQRPTKAELAILKQWIEAGRAEFPTTAVDVAEAKRPFLDEAYVFKTMYDHLLKAELTESAKYQRYFTLTHLHNNPKVTAANLRLYRAGLAKLLNSLSWRKQIIYPEPVDPHGVVLALDLRDLDWDLNYAWDKIIRFSDGKVVYPGYPYALTHDRNPEDANLNVTAKRVYRLTGASIPAVRVDWFLATASVPPLYHELLNLPTTAAELERLLKVNVGLNFKRDTLTRAGFLKSGVSAQNRLVERHAATFGAYWKSYDFKEKDGEANLFKFPLGPLNLFPLAKHPYRDQAFIHAGGELIWALPNGLHAYLLIDGNGKRINDGPADVVYDTNEFAGRGQIIVNGLSCMGCHKHGMIEFKDEVRARAGFQGAVLDKVKRQYPEAKVMQRLVKQDEEDYLQALERVIAPYLRVGADKDKKIKLFPEPISLLAKPYLRATVTAADAALELGLKNTQELVMAIKFNPKLRDDLGLKVWTTDGGSIDRKVWESLRDGTGSFTLFQEVAAELRRGTPVRSRRPKYELP